MSLPEVYAATRYGWGVVYCLTVAGIDCVFAERELGLTLPGLGPFADYSAEDGSLVIDDSAPVGSDLDRSRGVGVGLSLGFALLDTPTVRAALLAPANTARLTAPVAAGDMTIAVDDNGAWPATGAAYLGVERVTYTNRTGTTFVVGARGTAGGLAYAHDMGSAAGIVTSSPRWWIGREVTLYAYAVDPAARVPGSQYGDPGNVVCVWRGYIEEGPQRIAAGFRFEASSLDRRLARQLQASASGTVRDTVARTTAPISALYKIEISLNDSAGVQQWSYAIAWSPYAALVAGALYTGAELRAAVAAAFAVALAALGPPATARIGAWKWLIPTKGDAATAAAGRYVAHVAITTPAVNSRISAYLTGDQPGTSGVVLNQRVYLPAAAGVDYSLALPWMTYDAPNRPAKDTTSSIYGLTIELDDGEAALVDAPATVQIRVGEAKTARLICQTVSSIQGRLYVGSFSSASGDSMTPIEVIGATAEVLYSATGAVGAVALEHLHSSGTAGLRDPVYDTLPRAQGYGIAADRVAQASFQKLNAGALQSLTLSTTTGTRSLVDMFDGLLALTAHAIVARVDVGDAYRSVKLHAVSTALGGGGAVGSVTDADLLTLAESPVEVLDRARPSNLVRLRLDSGAEIVITDRSSVDTIGTVEQSWAIAHDDRDTVLEIATQLVGAWIATQPTIQTLAIRVGPNIDAHVGDVVNLELTHPAIYDWQTGASGYDGAAVVLGRATDLRTLSTTLTVAASASVDSRALSPSMLITAYTPGVSIEVDRGWYEHCRYTLAQAGASFPLLIYDPGGTESAADYLTIDAVTDTGFVCELGIAAIAGVLVPTASKTYATLPETAAATVYQIEFSHVDDGGTWI